MPPSSSISAFAAVGVLILLALLSAACASAPRDSRLRGEDFSAIAGRVAQALARSDLLSTRTADSPTWRWQAMQADNLSSDRLSGTDRWAVVSRVLFDPGTQQLLTSRNVQVLAPPEVIRAAQQQFAPDLPASNDPATHILSAEIRTLTRGFATTASASLANARSDTFLVRYTLRDAVTGAIVWTDEEELKRAAFGSLAD